ncbi:MAG: rod shape-determining protein MreC [Verrucomicrobiota bacterium]
MKRINLIALFVFVGIVAWIFTFDNEATNKIQSGAMSLLSPFMKASGETKEIYKDIKAPNRSKEELAGENEQLKLANDQLRIENDRLQLLAKDNATFRMALNLQESSALELVSARIISRRTSTWFSTLVIDKGYNQDVSTDSPVITAVMNESGRSDTGLVGKTTQVFADESVVILLTDEKCQVAAKIYGKTEQGICMGQRGATERTPYLKLRFLPKESQLEPGTPIVSSGVGGLFPIGLQIGYVKEFRRLDYDAEATIQPAVDFGSLEHVFVIVETGMPMDEVPIIPVQPMEAKAEVSGLPDEDGDLPVRKAEVE